MYYLVTDKGNQISYPQLGHSWKEGVLAIAKNVFDILSSRSPSSELVLPAAIDESRRNKHQRTQSKRSCVLKEAPPRTQPVVHIEEDCHAVGILLPLLLSAQVLLPMSTLRNDSRQLYHGAIVFALTFTRTRHSYYTGPQVWNSDPHKR